MNIKGKLMLLVGCMIVLLGLTGYGGYWGTSKVAHDVVELDRWGNIDMVMNEAVIQSVVSLDGAVRLYRAQPNETNLQASRVALTTAKAGLTEWSGMLAGEKQLAAIADTIASDIEIFEAQLQELIQVAEERHTLLKDFDALETKLDSLLEHAMETLVDPAKEQAATAGNLAEVVAWGKIDMAMNEEVIANALKMQAIFHEYLFTGEESEFQLLQAQNQVLTTGISQWNALLQSHPQMVAVGRDATTFGNAFSTLINALNKSHQKSQKIGSTTDSLSKGILDRLMATMEGTIDPAKEAAMADAEANKANVLVMLLIGVGVSLLAAGSFGLLLARSISAPLQKTVIMLTEMEQGCKYSHSLNNNWLFFTELNYITRRCCHNI